MIEPSPMLEMVERYLTERRRLGFALRIEGQQLRAFAHFADSCDHTGPLTIDLAMRWATAPSRRGRQFPGRRLDVLRPFARYRAAIDGGSEVPSRWLLGPPRRRPLHHIYTDEQVGALVAAASQLGPVDRLRPLTYATLFGLLAACGLRVSEALHLGRSDVDFAQGLAIIRATKFRKSRLVPLHVTTAAALRTYVTARERVRPRLAASTFLVHDSGSEVRYPMVRAVFVQLRRRLGWEDLIPRPRIHDLRHTFACRRLREWYARDGAATPQVAALATYLGHAHVTDTYWYLTGTPDLLALAARRFETLAHARTPVGAS